MRPLAIKGSFESAFEKEKLMKILEDDAFESGFLSISACWPRNGAHIDVYDAKL